MAGPERAGGRGVRGAAGARSGRALVTEWGLAFVLTEREATRVFEQRP